LPLFGEILAEMNQNPAPNGAPGFDAIRRKYLALLHQHQTNRAVIVYASAFLEDRPFSLDWLVSGLDRMRIRQA
jgi:hypothetical protein